MIVVLTRQAESDLERIADYIAADNPNRALTFVRELRASCEALAEFPAANPLVAAFPAIVRPWEPGHIRLKQ